MSKIKVLLLADHPLSTSGVGTQSRYLIDGLLSTGRYSFICFGGAVKHDNYDVVRINDDFIIKPTDGFGNPNLIRQTLATEKPDVVMLFNDPRFFFWLFEVEEEVHQICPIAYNHLWDNYPAPEFNKVLYDSCDLINCINPVSYDFVSKWFPERTNYVPHGVPDKLFFKLPTSDVLKFKAMLLGPQRTNHFVMLFVARNARRKNPSDVIAAFSEFLNQLEKKHGHRNATLVMHTDPLDQEGPNLHHVISIHNLQNNVVFSKDRIGFQEMNALYNVSDAVINLSSAEGFGLPILEAKMAERLAVAIKTGGLTRQMVDEDGTEFGAALDPDVNTMTGNQLIPYIYEDYVSIKNAAAGIMKVYEMSPQDRASLGKRAREHAVKNYSLTNLINAWDQSLTKLVGDWRKGTAPNSKRWARLEFVDGRNS